MQMFRIALYIYSQIRKKHFMYKKIAHKSPLFHLEPFRDPSPRANYPLFDFLEGGYLTYLTSNYKRKDIFLRA